MKNLLKKLKFKIQAKLITYKHVEYKRKKFEDRSVLEEIIFPNVLAEFDPQKILDIGREDYQYFYNEFFKGRELWTLDIDPEREEFGSKNHITDNVSNLENHFNKNTFDFILMNGVFGWGLNKKDKVESALEAIYNIMRPEGLFILGWNDVKELTPVPLLDIKALQKFKKYTFKPLKSSDFKCTNGEHTYSFFIKK
ncbi:class I SAM-dependent methyltransferase [Candidatus Parcubacteria bacterium]|nr:class I SAM-dependent methyltransferase [Candidatus Parcubacteria bacterium]